MTIDIVNALIQPDGASIMARQFFAEHTLNASKVSIAIDGIGKIAMPVDSATALQLRSVATQAKFGKGEKTVLNKTVRNAFEIAAAKLQINIDDAAFARMMDAMRDELGLSANARLVPHLHNLLVYEAGQFFKPHQDSEKMSGMVASLIIVLPSAHIGGHLVIKHAKDRHRFVSENLDARDLKCVAFYADCRHEITKVSQGYRIALSYNLVLESSPNSAEDLALDLAANPALQAALKMHFFPRDDSAGDGKPIKLAYFLDHSYTEHSLRWNLLKGTDSQNAAAFLSAAKALGLTPHLALADIHQTWDAEEGYGDDDEPELREMIEEYTELAFWLDADNKTLPYRKCWLDGSEMCWTSEVEESDLVESEYEGYTGNAGATMDYWYRRGAIVLWKQADAVSMHFDLNFTEACSELVALTQAPGNERQVAKTIMHAGKLLHKKAQATDLAAHHNLLMQLATYMQDDALATTLLVSFTCASIDVTSVAQLAQLQSRYGAAWCIKLLKLQAPHTPPAPLFFYKEPTHSVDVHALTRALRKAGIDPNLAAVILTHHVDTLISVDTFRAGQSRASQVAGLPKRIAALEKILFACSALDDKTASKKTIDHIIAHPLLYPTSDLVESLTALPNIGSGDWQKAFKRLLDFTVHGIHAELAKGIRKDGDWSIDATSRCDCKNCATLLEFVKSSTQPAKVWPLKQDDREHLMSKFRAEGLPLHFEVVKKGSPHQLVISKDPQIFAQAKKRFAQITDAQKQLAALS